MLFKQGIIVKCGKEMITAFLRYGVDNIDSIRVETKYGYFGYPNPETTGKYGDEPHPYGSVRVKCARSAALAPINFPMFQKPLLDTSTPVCTIW